METGNRDGRPEGIGDSGVGDLLGREYNEADQKISESGKQER